MVILPPVRAIQFRFEDYRKSRGERRMSDSKGISRRTVIKGALAGAATGIAGFPFISYGQSDVIRIGHLTPRTGFLGPLGEFAVQAVDMAGGGINPAGGRNRRQGGRRQEDT